MRNTIASAMLIVIAASAIVVHASSQAAGPAITLFLKDSKRYAAQTETALKTALLVVRPKLSGVELSSRGIRFAVAYGTIALSNMPIGCEAYTGALPTGTAKLKTQDDFIIHLRFLDRYPGDQDWGAGVLGKLFAAGEEPGAAEFQNYILAAQYGGLMGREVNVAFNDLGTAQIMQHFGLAAKTSMANQLDARPLVIGRDGEKYYALLSARAEGVVVTGKVTLTVCPWT